MSVVSAAVGIGTAAVGGMMAQDAANTQASAIGNASAGQRMIQMRQLTMAEESWKRYLSTYAPLEDEYAAESRGMRSIANQNAAAAKASAGAKAAYAGARERLNKNPGINPSSQAALQANQQINLAEAATDAVTQNAARDKVIDRGRAAMTDAISIGKNMPADATRGMGYASDTGAGVLREQRDLIQEQYKTNRLAAGGVGQAIGGLFQSKNFQSWLNSPSSTQGAAGLGDAYSGITPAAQSIGSVGGFDGGWNPALG